MSIIKRGVQAIVLAVGALTLSGCYAVVEEGHYYRSKPHFKHRHYDHQPHHYRYNHDDGDRHHRHRRGRHWHRY